MMHIDSETGNCDYVNYDKYSEMLREKNNEIEALQIEKADLEEELYEAKNIIDKFKKELQKYEGIIKKHNIKV